MTTIDSDIKNVVGDMNLITSDKQVVNVSKNDSALLMKYSKTLRCMVQDVGDKCGDIQVIVTKDVLLMVIDFCKFFDTVKDEPMEEHRDVPTKMQQLKWFPFYDKYKTLAPNAPPIPNAKGDIDRYNQYIEYLACNADYVAHLIIAANYFDIGPMIEIMSRVIVHHIHYVDNRNGNGLIDIAKIRHKPPPTQEEIEKKNKDYPWLWCREVPEKKKEKEEKEEKGENKDVIMDD